jgi:hypothetical protein
MTEPTTSARRPVTAAVAVLLALQIVAAGVFVARAADRPAPFQPPSRAADPNALPLTLESAYVAATDAALAWNGKAQLVAGSMQVDWPLSVNPGDPLAVAPGGWIALTFARPSADGNVAGTLSLFYERTAGVLVQHTAMDWPGTTPLVSLDPTAETVKSSTALLAVEARMGRAWRAQCPDLRHLSRVALDADPGSPPVWVVTYGDSRNPDPVILAHVNARTGEIIDLTDRSKPCGAG